MKKNIKIVALIFCLALQPVHAGKKRLTDGVPENLETIKRPAVAQEMQKQQSSTNEQFACSFCKKKFVLFPKLYNHIVLEHGDNAANSLYEQNHWQQESYFAPQVFPQLMPMPIQPSIQTFPEYSTDEQGISDAFDAMTAVACMVHYQQ
jgi:polyphosphate kinase